MKKVFLTKDSQYKRYNNTFVEVVRGIPYKDFKEVSPLELSVENDKFFRGYEVKTFDGATIQAFKDELI